jgi:glycine dehydrogenase
MASMYAVYHGPEGLLCIAERVRGFTAVIAAGLAKLGYRVRSGDHFDTLRVDLDAHVQAQVLARAVDRGLNLRRYDDGVGISCDETTSQSDAADLLEAFAIGSDRLPFELGALIAATELPVLALRRTSAFLTHPTFHRYHAEHEMLRYLNRLTTKDLSLTTSILYWRALPPSAKKDVDLNLLAAVPGTYEAPASSAYLYYTAEDKAWTKPVAIAIDR